MKIVAFVPGPEDAARTVAWTRALARAKEGVEFLCWQPGLGGKTEEAVREALAAAGDEEATVEVLRPGDPVPQVTQRVRAAQVEILVVPAFEIRGAWGDVRTAEDLMHSSPSRVFLTLYGDKTPNDLTNILVLAFGNQHDASTLRVAGRLAFSQGAQITLATVESDIGAAAVEAGEKGLRQLAHDAGLDLDRLEIRVAVDNHPVRGALTCFDGHELVMVASPNIGNVRTLRTALEGATAAVVKRAPPLSRRSLPEWIPRVNPSDYAELVQMLRHGSRWQADFVVMLGLAAAIASLGLLQDSPAVVIGSMLLAPLMTPMLGLGLALTQANPGLGRMCLDSIGLGIALTLIVSYALGAVVPGEMLTPEVLSRGGPNVLDLGIALFAGMAASYAMARPGISGAIAGVAIATALVPPLCSVGISLAYAAWLNAFGASALFLTNLLAIVLASSMVFHVMGIRDAVSFARYRRIARQFFFLLLGVVLVLAIPLGAALRSQVEEGRPQPLAHPVSRHVLNAIQGRVDREAGIEVMFVGRSSASGAIYMYLTSPSPIPASLHDEMVAVVQNALGAPNQSVKVFAVPLFWGD